MTTHEERWGIFVDFAAVVHDILTDARKELAEASEIDPVTPATIERIEKTWLKLAHHVQAFTRAAQSIQNLPTLTPEEAVMATSFVAGINNSIRETDEALRVFFQKTGLAFELPKREDSGEPLFDHKKVQ